MIRMDEANPPVRGKPTAARRSPQQKKQLSYDKDRRNTYGENDKASRKAIRRNKRWVNRANRHHDRQMLSRSVRVRDSGLEARVDLGLNSRMPKTWRKSADETLRRVVARKLRRRQEAERRSAEVRRTGG